MFTLILEGEWEVTGTPGYFYELTRPGKEAAIHISVRERQPQPATAEDAQSLMTMFLKTVKPIAPVPIRVLPEGKDQVRAVARCTSIDPDTDQSFDWLVFVILWRKHFLMCSCNAPTGESSVDEAEMLFASIAPVKRGLGGLLGRGR